MKKTSTLPLAAVGFASLALTNAPALADMLQTDALDLSPSDLTQAKDPLHVGCEQPANRDYHALLDSFENEASDDYKFSGCGSAI